MMAWDKSTITAVLSVVGAFTGAGSLIWHIFRSRQESREKQNEKRWREYEDSIYKNFQAKAHDLRTCVDRYLNRYENHNTRECCILISQLLNDVENMCAKTDKHPQTIDPTWEDFHEINEERIYDYIDKYIIDSTDIRPAELRELRRLLQRYAGDLDGRLRKQRDKMMVV